jgi:hypothetical protein
MWVPELPSEYARAAPRRHDERSCQCSHPPLPTVDDLGTQTWSAQTRPGPTPVRRLGPVSTSAVWHLFTARRASTAHSPLWRLPVSPDLGRPLLSSSSRSVKAALRAGLRRHRCQTTRTQRWSDRRWHPRSESGLVRSRSVAEPPAAASTRCCSGSLGTTNTAGSCPKVAPGCVSHLRRTSTPGPSCGGCMPVHYPVGRPIGAGAHGGVRTLRAGLAWLARSRRARGGPSTTSNSSRSPSSKGSSVAGPTLRPGGGRTAPPRSTRVQRPDADRRVVASPCRPVRPGNR